jgi:hypothetical protein
MKREPPPASLVEAAEHDYRAMLGRLAELTGSVRTLLDGGHTDFEAVADVWRTFRVQQERPATLLLAAVAVVQLAKSAEPPPPLGTPSSAPEGAP